MKLSFFVIFSTTALASAFAPRTFVRAGAAPYVSDGLRVPMKQSLTSPLQSLRDEGEED